MQTHNSSKGKMKKIMVGLDPDKAALLKRVAWLSGRSISATVRNMIVDGLDLELKRFSATKLQKELDDHTKILKEERDELDDSTD